jgi:hypothetical protein
MLKHSTLLSSLGLAASLCGVALPSTAASLPAVQHAGNIAFVTGGIGLDESTAFKSAMKEWPLTLLFAERIGQRAEYVANVQVEVSDLKGHTAIDTTWQRHWMARPCAKWLRLHKVKRPKLPFCGLSTRVNNHSHSTQRQFA